MERRSCCSNLCEAAKNGHISCCHYFGFSQVNEEFSTVFPYFPLQAAAFSGHIAATMLLIDNGANIQQGGSDGWSPIHRAASRNQSAIIALLVSRGAKLNASNSCGDTPAHVASSCGHSAALLALLRTGASITSRNRNGKTVLDVAQNNAVKRIVAAFESAAPCPNLRSPCATIADAAAADHFDCCRLGIIGAACDGSIDKADGKGMTPLMVAARFGSVASAALLIGSGANVGARDTDDAFTALHYAAAANMAAVASLFLDKGADPDAIDRSQRTALHVAAALGHTAVALVIALRHERARTALDDNGETAAEVALRAGNVETAKVLSQFAADTPSPQEMRAATASLPRPQHPQHSQEQQPSPAHDEQCHVGDVACVCLRDTLVRRHARCLSRLAARPGIVDGAASLAELHRSGQLASQSDLDFVAGAWPAQLPILLALGATSSTFLQPLAALSPPQRDLFDAAVSGGATAVRAALSAAGASVDDTLTQCGATALHAACAKDNTAAARVLIAAGADIHSRNCHGHTPAHLAAARGHVDAFVLLQNCGADRFRERDAAGLSAHMLLDDEAAFSAAAQPLDFQVVLCETTRTTPLHVAAGYRANKVTTRLLQAFGNSGAAIDAVRDAAGRTPLLVAAGSNQLTTITALLAVGCSATAVDICGRSSLHYAAAIQGRGSRNLIRYLSRYDPSVLRPDANGLIPIHIAAQNGSAEAVSALLSDIWSGGSARPNSPPPSLTATMASPTQANLPSPAAVVTLPQHQHQQQQLLSPTGDGSGMLPLALALREGHHDAARVLLECATATFLGHHFEWKAWRDPLHGRTLLHWAVFGTRAGAAGVGGLACVGLVLSAFGNDAVMLQTRDATDGKMTPGEMCRVEGLGSREAAALLL